MLDVRGKARFLLFVGLASLACGPSLATVHEGAVRFEHCYGVDLDPQAQPPQRKACWQLWATSYTVGQPRDRIEYAQRRLHALEGEDSACPRLALGRDERAEKRQFYVVVPEPTSVHASPPPIATVGEAGPELEATGNEHAKSADGKLASGGAKTGGVTKASNAAGEPPAARCAATCRESWQSCDAGCDASPKPSCSECKGSYSKCMRRCFD